MNCTLKKTTVVSASSRSGSRPNAPRKYDVFVSFRGDTRNNITSHLHAALKREFILSFRDDKQIEKGNEITPSLIQAIKDSSVSIIVFSKDYASSRWCLDELAQIMQCRKDEGQFVIPIFYKVDPSHVRKQTGVYEKAFEQHEKDFMNNPERVNRWKAALSEAGYLSGRHYQDFTDESNLIQEITTDISTKLEQIHNRGQTLKDVVGMDEMIEPIEELLGKFQRVGIWGMGGVGKTTMANAVFAKLSSRYDNCCFLENIRGKTEKLGLESVCSSLVSELLGQDMPSNTSNVLRNAFVARRLGRKKAMVVLDDIDSFDQFEGLQENICNFLGEGSKVIITTRNRKLLQGKGYEILEAKGLSYHNSRQLFIRKAFGSDYPEHGYEQLIEGFVEYTRHNPLALTVLGSYVHSEDKRLWDGVLTKLRARSPNDEIQKVLRLSYDGLAYEEKQTFLDIACFLKGENEAFVEELLKSYEFHPTVGMQNLKDKALIVTTNGKVEMHDLIQEMGLQIVREENISEPGKRSRLWDPSEIYDVLKNCEGEKEVEGIIFNTDEINRPLDLTAETFNKMTRIRFLKVYSSLTQIMSDELGIAAGLESISTKIRYFHWAGYPGKSLPSNFCAELLLELNLEWSRVETLWEGVQDLANLRRVKLECCFALRELPDFSKARSLETIDLSGCARLCHVHASLLSLHSLISLDVSGCHSLESLQSRIHLKSLKEVNITGCYRLKEFSVSSEELTSLDLDGNDIEELSPSIGRCSKLRRLNLCDTKLKNLKVLSCLTYLEELRVSSQKIDSVDLHVLFDSLCSLQSLTLEMCCDLTELPDNIRQLSSLEELYLGGCRNLQYLPELPPSLKLLDATDCTALSFNLSFVHHLRNLNRLLLHTLSPWYPPQTMLCRFKLMCLGIQKMAVLFDALPSLEVLSLKEWRDLTELPHNITHLSELRYLSVEGCTMLRSLPELPPSLRKLIATDCTSLKTVSASTISSTSENYGEKIFSFINCVNLDLGAIEEQANLLLEKAVHEKNDVTVCFPGKKVPKLFGNHRSQNDSSIIELPPASYNLAGFVFCAVVPDSFPREEHMAPEISFGFTLDEMTREIAFSSLIKFSPGNVLLRSNPKLSELIVRKIEEKRRNHETTSYDQNLLFKFDFGIGSDILIKECGVYPIYASEYYNVDQQGKSAAFNFEFPKTQGHND
ncbi:disease resistance protein RML1A-like [Neltuma alba]|uniref:disease resistance protein RML1A-like n=1 Tax=Neltuma alba TaxID=207710 RepID=UPI0010A55CF1|nr:disease resistance protein RML1A-like [Prosopis alba]